MVTQPDTTQPNPGATPSRVLIIEDDRGLRESLAVVLSHQDLHIAQAGSAEDGEPMIAVDDPDLVILDINLPGRSGLELLADLRRRGDDRQVLLLSARHEVGDRVVGLDAGADDYLAKPFALEELLARVRTMLRRTRGASAGTTVAAIGPSLHLGAVEVDRDARRVTSHGDEVELTKMEYDLLVLLVDNHDRVLARSVLHDRLWGYGEEYGSNTLEVLVSSVRKKLEASGAERIIHTVRGVGYVARLTSQQQTSQQQGFSQQGPGPGGSA